MKISLVGIWRRVLLAVAILLTAGSVTFFAGKIWLASSWSASPDPAKWVRAANLEPGNAEYWRHLGRFEQWDFARGDPRKAVDYFRRAVQVDPQSDTDWMDFASAYETVGEPAQAREAFEHSRASHPDSTQVAWRYGSFLLRQRDFAEANREIRRALEKDPALTLAAVNQCWNAGESFSQITDEALPQRSSYFLDTLDYFTSQHRPADALAIWERLQQLQQHFELARSLRFIDELIRWDRYDDASRVWRQALASSNWPQDSAAGSSLIFNGGFEYDLVHGGFGWRDAPVAGASISLDAAVFHSGKRSLRVTFDGSANVDFWQLYQYVTVEPGRRYHFAAYLRTEDISTDSGIRFVIDDLRHPEKLSLQTNNFVGTQPWTRVDAEVTTSADTHWLTVVLRRFPSTHFDNKLRGTVWVDDVSLTPASATGAGGVP